MPRRSPKQIPDRAPLRLADCRAKRRFANEKDARAAADIQELADMQLELFVYQCSQCGQWHLTRQQRDRA